jgi:hypothetical protein
LRYLLAGDTGFHKVEEFEKIGSSELLFIECSRVLQRYRLDGGLTDSQLEAAVTHFHEIYDAFHIFDMGPQVKARSAGPFPTTIGTLDALHLSTAILWSEQERSPLLLFTYDQQMKTCAHAMGLHSFPTSRSNRSY